MISQYVTLLFLIMNNIIIPGDLLIIMAQIIVAVQMVYEERFVMRYNVHPLVAVGLEGELEPY